MLTISERRERILLSSSNSKQSSRFMFFQSCWEVEVELPPSPYLLTSEVSQSKYFVSSEQHYPMSVYAPLLIHPRPLLLPFSLIIFGVLIVFWRLDMRFSIIVSSVACSYIVEG
ncbi:hypothetical protein Patl1_20343 [Pistacia atlantica]|uniref:Uncharacterized protein n=1 Tax=Pistacia atlantica TaxID=434234 RepID=A0ACC1BML0_9ROSI|nr:hypothetical protein Patl1_20343 [Pistacia atlantica]